jgi:hypothetical protein
MKVANLKSNQLSSLTVSSFLTSLSGALTIQRLVIFFTYFLNSYKINGLKKVLLIIVLISNYYPVVLFSQLVPLEGAFGGATAPKLYNPGFNSIQVLVDSIKDYFYETSLVEHSPTGWSMVTKVKYVSNVSPNIERFSTVLQEQNIYAVSEENGKIKFLKQNRGLYEQVGPTYQSRGRVSFNLFKMVGNAPLIAVRDDYDKTNSIISLINDNWVKLGQNDIDSVGDSDGIRMFSAIDALEVNEFGNIYILQRAVSYIPVADLYPYITKFYVRSYSSNHWVNVATPEPYFSLRGISYFADCKLFMNGNIPFISSGIHDGLPVFTLLEVHGNKWTNYRIII